mmetsp:Transcript_105564/g.278790  ORF Transcript_105564/g.278790 Transcript_105564/m.278790 type:complete len:280 (+) Transcript_105564:658-1497(+)
MVSAWPTPVRPSDSSSFATLKAALVSARILSSSACILASSASSFCRVATSSLSVAEVAAALSIFAVSVSRSSSSSDFFSSVLAIWSSQYAFSSASLDPSASSLVIRSVISAFTLTNGSSPAAEPYLTTAEMREASCASVEEWYSLASRFTSVTTSTLARSARVRNLEDTPDSTLICTSEYACASAPEVVSAKTFFAAAIALSSSAREAFDASWSAAVCTQSVCAVSSFSLKSARALTATWRSFSAVALPSLAADSAAFSSFMSLVSAVVWSSRDCLSIS